MEADVEKEYKVMNPVVKNKLNENIEAANKTADKDEIRFGNFLENEYKCSGLCKKGIFFLF